MVPLWLCGKAIEGLTSYLLEEAQKHVLFPFRRVNSTRARLNESHLIGGTMALRRPHVPTTSEHADGSAWLDMDGEHTFPVFLGC